MADFNLSAAELATVKFLYKHIKSSEAVIADKRVEAFKGVSAVKALMSPEYEKERGVVALSSGEELEQLLSTFLSKGVFVKARSINNTKFLQPDINRAWSEEGLYVWVWQGSQLMMLLGAAALLAVAVSLIMFPLWPSSMKGLSW